MRRDGADLRGTGAFGDLLQLLLRLGILGQVFDELRVDLEQGRLEVVEDLQRVQAGAEVLQGQPAAERAKCLGEVLRLSHRILVMCEGRITGELKAGEATQENIMQYATQRETTQFN